MQRKLLSNDDASPDSKRASLLSQTIKNSVQSNQIKFQSLQIIEEERKHNRNSL
jgi:hypothetical protein